LSHRSSRRSVEHGRDPENGPPGAVEAGGAQILTGDREDLEKLATAHPEVWVQPL
jgi:hypothetical protein